MTAAIEETANARLIVRVDEKDKDVIGTSVPHVISPLPDVA